MEEYLRTKLFQRNRKGVELTEEGEHFLRFAERSLHDLDVTTSEMREFSELNRRRVRIGALASLAVRIVTPSIKALSDMHSGIAVGLRDGNVTDILEGVRRNELDLGVTTAPHFDESLSFKPLMKDRLVVVVPQSHKLATRTEPVRLSDLQEYPFIGFGHGTNIKQMLEMVPEIPSNIISPIYEISSYVPLEAMLKIGLGATVIPELNALQSSQNVFSFLPIEPEIQWNIFVVTKKGRKPYSELTIFVKEIKKQVRRAGYQCLF